MYLECTVSFRCHIYWVYMSLFWWIWYTWSTLCEVFDVHDLLWNQCEISDIHDTLQVWNILYPTPHTPPHPTPHHRFCILSFACVRGYCKSVVLIAVDKLLKLTLSFYFICLLLFCLFIVIICGRHCYFICLLLLFVADIVSWFDLFIVITCSRHCYFILFVYCYYLRQTLMSAVAGWPTVPTHVTTQLEASSVPAPSACCWTVTDRPA